MKRRLLLICSPLALSLGLFGQSWRLDRARLCFVRIENNGAMNVLPSWVRISDYSVPLVGGQAACLFLEPESHDLQVTSTVPYEPDSSDTESCKSEVIKLVVAPNEERTFF